MYQGPLECWAKVSFVAVALDYGIYLLFIAALFLISSKYKHATEDKASILSLKCFGQKSNGIFRIIITYLHIRMQQFTQSVQPREHWEHAWPWIVVVAGYDLNQAETFKLILSPHLIGQERPHGASDWSVMQSIIRERSWGVLGRSKLDTMCNSLICVETLTHNCAFKSERKTLPMQPA